MAENLSANTNSSGEGATVGHNVQFLKDQTLNLFKQLLSEEQAKDAATEKHIKPFKDQIKNLKQFIP